jgi:hypothetical protein
MKYPINQTTLNTLSEKLNCPNIIFGYTSTSILASLYSEVNTNTEYVDVVAIFATEKVYLYSNVPLDNIYKYKTTLEQQPDASSGKLFNLLIKNAQGVVYTLLGDFSEVINGD